MKLAPVYHDSKFSMAEIAEAFGIEPETVCGISYAALRLRIPLNNGTFVEFRDGDDENDREVKVYSNDILKYR